MVDPGKRSKSDETIRAQKGFLSMVDAGLFAIMIFMVSLLIFQSMSIGFFHSSEAARDEFKRESVVDIHEVAMDSIIKETGYIREVEGIDGEKEKRVSYHNVSVETAIGNYLYLKNEANENLGNYDLNELRTDIKQRYISVANNISNYHFALESEYRQADIFISDIDEVEDRTDLPDKRSAYSTSTTLGLETVTITLYIWR